MTVIKARKIMDEICDNISGDAKEWIASIDRLEKKVSSLDAIIENMEEADENATFQLVSQLPASGRSGIYYIVLNSTSNKYEEYKWNGSSFDKVGTIEDEVVEAQPGGTDNDGQGNEPEAEEEPETSEEPEE